MSDQYPAKGKVVLRPAKVCKLNGSSVVFALFNFVQTGWVPTGARFGQCLGRSEANWHPEGFCFFQV